MLFAVEEARKRGGRPGFGGAPRAELGCFGESGWMKKVKKGKSDGKWSALCGFLWFLELEKMENG